MDIFISWGESYIGFRTQCVIITQKKLDPHPPTPITCAGFSKNFVSVLKNFSNVHDSKKGRLHL